VLCAALVAASIAPAPAHAVVSGSCSGTFTGTVNTYGAGSCTLVLAGGFFLVTAHSAGYAVAVDVSDPTGNIAFANCSSYGYSNATCTSTTGYTITSGGVASLAIGVPLTCTAEGLMTGTFSCESLNI
jgi:hypothetical protein